MESEDSQPQTTDTATVQTTKAAEPTLLASWDFTGKNGTTNSAIADSTGKYNLTLKDGAKIEQYGDRSNNEALSLRGGGQYAQIDDQLFKDAGDSFTLEFASKTRHDDSGKFFSFIVGKDGSNDANTTDQANANKYLMFYNSNCCTARPPSRALSPTTTGVTNRDPRSPFPATTTAGPITRLSWTAPTLPCSATMP